MSHQYQVFKAFHTGDANPKYKPLITSIELTTRCNLNCTFCARESVYNSRGFTDMPYERYLDILRRYPECIRDLRLFRHGEPMLYPRIVDAVRDARKAGAKSVGFTTNGCYSSELNRKLVDAGLTVVAFSFDAATREAYEKTRIGGDYDQVFENIHAMIRLRRLVNPSLNVSINIVDTPLQHPGLEEFVNYWTRQGIRVDVSQLMDWAGEKTLPAEMKYVKPKQPDSCMSPWLCVNILVDGSVTPCCIWPGEPLGNVFTDDLYRVWRGEKYRVLRESLIEGRSNHSACSKCASSAFDPRSSYNVNSRDGLWALKYSFQRVKAAVKRRL